MPTVLAFTVVMTPVDGGWVQAQLRELPGVITCAPTQDEARAAVVDALREYLASLADPSTDVPAGNATDVVRVVIEAA
ncbi:MAG: type II toxin-antitoxin system HicB family antitoxin [Mycobacteriales bacterium]